MDDTLVEAVARACAEPTLSQALSRIAIWENDRAVKQALRNTSANTREPSGALWETCFELCFSEVLRHYPAANPTQMLLWCPACGDRHIDTGEFATKPHHTHACQSCGMVWRPANNPTVGVQFLPGFKDAP